MWIGRFQLDKHDKTNKLPSFINKIARPMEKVYIMFYLGSVHRAHHKKNKNKIINKIARPMEKVYTMFYLGSVHRAHQKKKKKKK